MTEESGRVAITGGFGFLGWHLACRLRAQDGIDPIRLGRDDLGDRDRLVSRLDGVDTIYHVAGVNRADSDDEVENGNIDLAQRVASVVRQAATPVRLVYANSIQADLDNPYGRGKHQAGEILEKAVRDVGGSYANVLLPNLFGEHGRPSYNSFVATFADAVANDKRPTVSQDREVPLLHAQAAAAALMQAAADDAAPRHRPAASLRRVGEVLALLQHFHELYAVRGELPDLSDAFAVDLFNTYRSYLFPHRYPMTPQVHADQRGELFETVRAHGGTGQSFVSTTVPGATRGDHYHLSKVERFFVLKGEAEIALRRLYDDRVVRFRVSGEAPAFIDMPTMWVHNITNVGDSELVTLFWADQLLDPDQPDQYPERVEVTVP